MSELFTAQEVREWVRDECKTFGGIRAWARETGISPGHVSRVLRSQKEPGPKILDHFGLRAVTMYADK